VIVESLRQPSELKSKRRAESGNFLQRAALDCGIADLNECKLLYAVIPRIGVRSADLRSAQPGLRE
jgi:hypothetical protein